MSEINNEEERWWTEESDSNIAKFFDPKDMAVDINHIPIGYLLRKIDHGDIDLLPSFQRQFDLWGDGAKSQLIESILLNFPIPPLYFDASSYDRWVVIDGLQRLWTLKNFVIEGKFKLKGLTVLSHLNGFSFTELERQYQRKIEEYSLVVYLVRPGAPRFVIYDIFRRLNTGGVALNAQEIRHALNARASAFLEGLVKDRNFKQLVSPKQKRMEDYELVLRFCAFTLRDFQLYQPPMSNFLDRTMEELEHADNHVLDALSLRFFRALAFISEVFGDQLFKKTAAYSNSKRFNKGLYEAWTVTIASLDDESFEIIKNRKKSLIVNFLYLTEEPDFNESISVTTASKRAVFTRFGKIKKLVLEILT